MYFFDFIKYIMKRIHLKRKKKKSPLDYILIVITLLIISVIIAFHYIGKHITPVIQSYAEKQAKRISSVIISQAITDEVLETIQAEEMFITSKSENGNTSSVDFNSAVMNQILAKVSKSVKGYLKKLESGDIEDINLSDASVFNVSQKKLKNGIIYEVPIGIIFKNGLLSNVGPKIPIKLNIIGDIVTDIVTDVKNYGINNAIVQVSVKVTVSEKVIFPYETSQIKIESNIPIAMKLIQGNVPSYYFTGSNTPSLSISSD